LGSKREPFLLSTRRASSFIAPQRKLRARQGIPIGSDRQKLRVIVMRRAIQTARARLDITELGLRDEPTAKGLLCCLSQQLGREVLARAVVDVRRGFVIGTAENRARSSGAKSAWCSITSGGTRKQRFLHAAGSLRWTCAGRTSERPCSDN